MTTAATGYDTRGIRIADSYRCSNCCQHDLSGHDVYKVGRLYLCFPCWQQFTQNFCECFPDLASYRGV